MCLGSAVSWCSPSCVGPSHAALGLVCVTNSIRQKWWNHLKSRLVKTLAPALLPSWMSLMESSCHVALWSIPHGEEQGGPEELQASCHSQGSELRSRFSGSSPAFRCLQARLTAWTQPRERPSGSPTQLSCSQILNPQWLGLWTLVLQQQITVGLKDTV